MSPRQMRTVLCAFCDLCGALQAYDQEGRGDSLHDWKSHLETIDEIIEDFPELSLRLPRNLRDINAVLKS